jgi:hypothetical protein
MPDWERHLKNGNSHVSVATLDLWLQFEEPLSLSTIHTKVPFIPPITPPPIVRRAPFIYEKGYGLIKLNGRYISEELLCR